MQNKKKERMPFGLITIVYGNGKNLRFDYSKQSETLERYSETIGMSETYFRTINNVLGADGISTTLYYDDEREDFYDEITDLAILGERIKLLDRAEVI